MALLAGLIQAASLIRGDVLVFPGIPRILSAFFRLLGTPGTWRQIGVTLGHLVLALAFSAVLGTALGLAQGLNRFLRELLRPLTVFLRTIPIIVLTVIIMVLTSYDRVPVAAGTLILIPMISEAAYEGCRRISPELTDVWRMNSRLNLTVLCRVHLPLMGGYLRQAWFNAAGMGIRMVVTTEYLVQTRNSLGKAVFTSQYFYEYDEIYAYAVIMILLVLLLSEAPKALARAGRKRRTAG